MWWPYEVSVKKKKDLRNIEGFIFSNCDTFNLKSQHDGSLEPIYNLYLYEEV